MNETDIISNEFKITVSDDDHSQSNCDTACLITPSFYEISMNPTLFQESSVSFPAIKYLDDDGNVLYYNQKSYIFSGNNDGTMNTAIEDSLSDYSEEFLTAIEKNSDGNIQIEKNINKICQYQVKDDKKIFDNSGEYCIYPSIQNNNNTYDEWNFMNTSMDQSTQSTRNSKNQKTCIGVITDVIFRGFSETEDEDSVDVPTTINDDVNLVTLYPKGDKDSSFFQKNKDQHIFYENSEYCFKINYLDENKEVKKNSLKNNFPISKISKESAEEIPACSTDESLKVDLLEQGNNEISEKRISTRLTSSEAIICGAKALLRMFTNVPSDI